MLKSESCDERLDCCCGVDVHCLEDGRILERVGDGLIIEARAVDSQGWSMLVFAMKDGPFKSRLKLGNGRFGDVMSDVVTVFLPQVVAKFGDVFGWHRR